MNKMHLVCNAHLDPVWLWRFDEGASEALSTFRAAADFCEEFNGFVFNHNEMILYQWVEKFDNKLFKRIQDLVKKGKWNIIGGWFLQPDCNMPQGESFVRQIIEGRKYFLEKFGVMPTTAINFDSFGHTRGLVQIMEKCGYDSYIICRPPKHEFPFSECDFIWKGYDGSTVVVHRSDENYNSIKGNAKKELLEFIDANKDMETGLFLWGVGNHGGGPSRKDLKGISELMNEQTGFEIVHSTPEAYFSEVLGTKDKMPVVSRPLNPVAPGCYTAQIRIKQKHRRLENEIYMVEKMMSSAALQGLLVYPKEEIAEAVIDMLTAEFHDALPGSGIKPVEEDTLRILEHGLEITARLKLTALFALSAGQQCLTEGQVPVMIYNPHPYTVKAVVPCSFVLPQQNWKNEFSYPIAYQNGVEIPCQAEHEESNFNMDWCRLAIVSAELAPSSLSRIDFAFKTLDKRPTGTLPVEGGCFVFKTDRVETRVNIMTGLLDKYSVDNVDFVKNGAFGLHILSDHTNPWGCGNQKHNHGEGIFALMDKKDGSVFSGHYDKVIDSVRVIEDGAVRTVVEAVFRYKHSSAVQRYFFNKQSTEIGIETTVFWNEKTKMLKLYVPTNIGADKIIGQSAFGKDELRVDGAEDVAQAYAVAVSKDKALICCNDGTYGCDFKEGDMRFTLLRSAGYSAADFVCGKALNENRFYPRMEQGERKFCFWLDGGDVSQILANADARAGIHNQPPYSLPFCPSGEGKTPLPLIIIESENNKVVMSSFKKAEYGENYTVRVYHSQNEDVDATVIIPIFGIKNNFTLTPFEVKTFNLDINKKELLECGMISEVTSKFNRTKP